MLLSKVIQSRQYIICLTSHCIHHIRPPDLQPTHYFVVVPHFNITRKYSKRIFFFFQEKCQMNQSASQFGMIDNCVRTVVLESLGNL